MLNVERLNVELRFLSEGNWCKLRGLRRIAERKREMFAISTTRAAPNTGKFVS
jgi:hypothetical protein